MTKRLSLWCKGEGGVEEGAGYPLQKKKGTQRPEKEGESVQKFQVDHMTMGGRRKKGKKKKKLTLNWTSH